MLAYMGPCEALWWLYCYARNHSTRFRILGRSPEIEEPWMAPGSRGVYLGHTDYVDDTDFLEPRMALLFLGYALRFLFYLIDF